MEYRRFNDTYVVRMDRGEEIMGTLTALCEQEGIRLASVAAIGAVDRAVVGLYDVGEKVYHQKENEPTELDTEQSEIVKRYADRLPYVPRQAILENFS